MTQWLKYFLVGIFETAEGAIKTLSSVIDLKLRLEKQIFISFGKRSNKANILLQHLFKKPIIHVNQVKEISETSFKAANNLVTEFVKAGILKETTGHSRNRMFIFEEYIQLFQS
jgi:Fic family protein